MSEIDPEDLSLDLRVGFRFAELMEKRFPTSVRDIANTLADRKIVEAINTVGGGRIGRQLDQLATQIAAEQAQALATGKSGPAPQLGYKNLEDFCTKLLFEIYAFNPESTSLKWCPDWWKHVGAHYRIEALWRAYEYHRHEGLTGIANWLKSYADPTMRALMDPEGPFTFCHAIKGHEYQGDAVAPLSHTPMPPNWPHETGRTPATPPAADGPDEQEFHDTDDEGI
ncbi:MULTISPECIES: DUF4913 domain-containing protein [Nocardia]|uniref:DUF4913 domain-containing protein n=1 Tax=Nocardia TaxID=1817 RepID=UPI002457532B|nr:MULTISPECIES: DUF4913 domain-containing protein [Nocardia]